MKLRWTADSRRSLRAIRAEYNTFSPGAGTRATDRIVAAVERLKQFPELGRLVPEYNVETVREVIQGRFRVWYVVDPDAITVIAVFHGTRDTR